MRYPKVLERVDSPEQIFRQSFSLGAPLHFLQNYINAKLRHLSFFVYIGLEKPQWGVANNITSYTHTHLLHGDSHLFS